ncbi:class I SAM-dependent DNA methyltransferase [Desmospora activa]|uniref:Methyltransferase family protein n=1 Tax=Desmospora activa DSM 45169 TaxID=1121389 RepID=A0A2T4ZCS2_9BACL|nr:class I SAM-dependent methyltransferase [Desmospora activa]PTM59680.1 methyltransferase family protein [Desmospora activa DSM 45169]
MSQPDAYDPFAVIYHQHWGYFPDRFWPILEERILSHLPADASILDLCCGTGGLAKKLTEAGWDVTGVDGSVSMLEIARREAPHAHFLHSDAREFHLETKFHAALSTFDSLNHILEWEGLKQTFTNVYHTLLPGGVFFFDLNMQEGYHRRWQGQFHIVHTNHAVMVTSRYDEQRLAEMDFTLFTLEQDDWHRTNFTLTQRCYEEEEVTRELQEAGFSDVKVHDAALFGWDQTGRSFFYARKSSEGVSG